MSSLGLGGNWGGSIFISTEQRLLTKPKNDGFSFK